ncbi:transcriptional regulatory protein RCO1, partial [Rhypophila decipiens]
MNSATRRSTRSRYSSPQITPGGRRSGESPSTTGLDAQKSFMQRWLEPPVQNKASYQEDNLMRKGVVENMAPLGTMPKVGLFSTKKTAPAAAPPATEHVRPPTKIIFKPRQPAPAPSTPTPTPPVAAPAAPRAPEEDETEEEEIDDNTGSDGEDFGREGTPVHAKSLSRRSLPSRAGDSSRDDNWSTGKPSPSYNPVSRRSMSRASFGQGQGQQQYASFGSLPNSTANATTGFSESRELSDKVIEYAIDLALAHFRYPTAWALRTLYDENFDNSQFLTMAEKVFNQTADDDTVAAFAKLIRKKKREYKKNPDLHEYWSKDQVPTGSSHPKPAAYSHLLRFDTSILHRRIKREPVSEQLQPEPEPERPEPQVSPSKVSPSKVSPSKVSPSKLSPSKISPSKRKTRARSVSSASSLSDVRSIELTPPPTGGVDQDGDEDMPDGDGFDGPDDGPDGPSSRASPAAERERKRERSNTAAASQPMAKRPRRSTAPKKNGNVSPADTPSSPTPATGQGSSHPTPPAHEEPYDMPAVLDVPQFPNQGNKKSSRSGNNGLVFQSKVGRIDPNDPKQQLRQNARKVTNNDNQVPETSFSRVEEPKLGEQIKKAFADLVNIPAPAASEVARTPSVAPPAPVRSTPTAPAPNGRPIRFSRKRSHDELEEQASPTALHFASEVPSTAANSRAATPALRTAKKARTGLRVKNSPKKKSGPLAGVPRASGERSSPVGNGNMVEKDDQNDDYCASCSGNGELICCDGCTRSFHLSCVDPPLSQDSMQQEWFCNVCRTRLNPPAFPVPTGPFGELLARLDAKNSSAFRLPNDIVNRFEGVRANADGEYEEIVAVVKPGRKKKNGEEELPDFYRLRDAEGNAIICHQCNKSSSATRPIIPCSLCGIWWHLDCLDPPLANPPILRTWKCPLHVDEVLARVPALLAPAHKYRKVKGAPVIQPAYSRENVNNGYIEVDMDDDSIGRGWRDINSFGRTVRLSARGIEADFFSRVRRNRKGKPLPPLNARQPVAPVAPVPAVPAVPAVPFDQRDLEQQQAALSLRQLSATDAAPVSDLINALLAKADPGLITLMAQGSVNKAQEELAETDQQSLRAVLAWMDKVSKDVRMRLERITPDRQNSPHSAIGDSGSTVRDSGARLPSLTNSQSTEADVE